MRPWLPAQESGQFAIASYQSGGIPTLGSSAGAVSEEEATPINQWETRYGVRVDMLAALAYIFGPVSGALVTIVHVSAVFEYFVSSTFYINHGNYQRLRSLSWYVGE